MKLTFSTKAWEQYLYWQTTDKKILKRVNLLIKDIQSTPNEGIGKPELLKHGLSGYWSRRINTKPQHIDYGSFSFCCYYLINPPTSLSVERVGLRFQSPSSNVLAT